MDNIVKAWGAIVAVLISFALAFATASPRPISPPQSVQGTVLPGFKYQGAGSCAAVACHNAQVALGSPGSEYTTWLSQIPGKPADKHSQAFDVLFSEAAQVMSRNLGPARPPAPKDSLCLNCHVVPDHDLLEGRRLFDKSFIRDGVSCESCHGPAEKWLVEHYRSDWQAKHADEKLALGMKDTRSLVGRTRLCATCHVGSLPAEKGGLGQDVYHDLYAAGHPPLLFEMGAYHATTLHHWQDRRDKDPAYGGTADFEIRAWLVGRLVTAQSALELLAWRAEKDDRPWPEFAEYDCFACHHELKVPSRRPKPAPDKRKAGSLPVSTWHTAMLPHALEALDIQGDPVLIDALQHLARRMEQPLPPKDEVAKEARQAAQHLERRLNDLKDGFEIDLDRLHQSIRSADLADESWDSAAHVYLSLAALHNTWSDMKRSPAERATLKTMLLDLRPRLAFPPGWQSPRFFEPDVLKLLHPGEKVK